MSKSASTLNPMWVSQTREHVLEFLRVSKYPHPDRDGTRGNKLSYPEWLIVFIALASVKCPVKSGLGIHKLTPQ